MQSNKLDLNQQYSELNEMSLWEMTHLPTDGHDYDQGPSAMGPSTGMSHVRNHSDESMSSNYSQEMLTRNHPSLNNYHPNMDNNIFQPQSSPTASSSANQSGGSYLCVPTKKEAPPSAYLPSRRRGLSPRSDEEDELADEPLDPNATEQERQAHKRRRNTLAARRSRQRRQVQFQKLEEDVVRLNRERDIWKERAMMMQRMLSTHGLPCPTFSDR